jgi:hypothetical protein
MECDVRGLLEATEVNDTDNEGRHAENALMQDAQNERTNVKCRSVMNRLVENTTQRGLTMVLLLIKQSKR